MNSAIPTTTKKIIHIAKVTGIHGMENHLLTLLPLLNGKKYEIIFLMITEPALPVDEYLERLKALGVSAHRITIHGDLDPFFLWKIFSFLRKQQPDLVHTHLIHADLYGTLAAKIAGIRKVISSKHGYDEFRFNRFFALLDKIAAQGNERIITISDALGNFLCKTEGLDKNKMVTIYYGLDLPEQTASYEHDKNAIQREFHLAPQGLLIAIVGRLIPVKGHIYFLEAYKEILKVHPSTRLLIVGDGELRSELVLTCKAFGIDKKVIFAGFRADVDCIMESIDLLVHPALGEGFGLVCLEAMAHAKPVVTSSVMALPEIIVDGETGLLVPPRDAQALAGAVLALLANKAKREQMGQKGRERCKALFSVERMVKSTEALYDEILGA